MQQILLKFPMDVVIRLEESKALNESWTVASLREALKRYITIHSNAHRYEANFKSHHVRVSRNFRTRTTSMESSTDKQFFTRTLVANSHRSSKFSYKKGAPTKP